MGIRSVVVDPVSMTMASGQMRETTIAVATQFEAATASGFCRASAIVRKSPVGGEDSGLCLRACAATASRIFSTPARLVRNDLGQLGGHRDPVTITLSDAPIFLLHLLQHDRERSDLVLYGERARSRRQRAIWRSANHLGVNATDVPADRR